MVYFWTFCFELLLLFFLSHAVTKACSQVFFFVTRSQQWTIYLLAFLFLPGTFVHEVAHFVTALFLLVPVGRMEFMPTLHQGGVKLGSVMIGKTDPLRRGLIGLAPLFVGVLCLFVSIYYFSSFPINPWYINVVLLLFIVFEIGNTMFSSKRDVEGLPLLLLLLGSFVVAGWVFGINLAEIVFKYLSSPSVAALFQQLSFYLLIPLGINGVIVVVAKMLQRNRKF